MHNKWGWLAAEGVAAAAGKARPTLFLLIDFFRHFRFSGKPNYAGGVTITEIELF